MTAPGSDLSPVAVDATRYPLLAQVSTPADLRSMTLEQLEGLCAELRGFMIENLSVHPGHFASSMGAVELTVALHYVFSAPDDRIVWDVGHQAYPHKLLTGRAPMFHTLRREGGLSGFPNPDESQYDTFTAGHASNSISAALGMAVADKLESKATGRPPRHVVAVIGDASISGGLAFEGLNNAANDDADLLIVLNDNDMSIDRNVGSLNSHLAHLTTSKAYNTLRYRAYRVLKKLRMVNERNKGRILRFNNSLKSLITKEQNVFEGLNIRYFGPFDGHNLARIIRVLTDIRDMKGPRLLHLRTIKGRGYAPAEENPTIWHAPGKFDPATGKRTEGQPASTDKPRKVKYQAVFGQQLTAMAREDKRIVAITAAMPTGTSVSVMQAQFPDRTFDVGISEGHAVTFAGGLAKEGLRPFVAIYSSFLQRAYDHIIHDVAVQRLPVTFCIDRAGLVGDDGVTHQGLYDISYLRNIPGMVVTAPRNALMLRRLMLTALRRSDFGPERGPMSIRYPRGASDSTDDTPDLSLESLPLGRGELLTPDTPADKADAVILTAGTIAAEAQTAIGKLSEYKIAHYDAVYINPLDETMLHTVARSGRPVVTVEDGTVAGGFGSAVLEWFAVHGYMVPVKMLGIPKIFPHHASVDRQKELCGISPAHIAQAVRTAVTNHKTTER